MEDRLASQIRFIVEIDKLKSVLRQTVLMDASRRENDAEHSWHLAMMALILAEHADAPDLDMSRIIKMLLVHDLVEIDAGDTFVYDEEGMKDKAAREERAADRIFAILPDDQAKGLRGLWEEFEERRSPEARFAAALDRLQPLLHNYHTRGASWQQHKITDAQVRSRNGHMVEGSTALWKQAEKMIEDAVEQGFLQRG